MDTIFKYNQRLNSSDFIPKSNSDIGYLIADDFFGVTIPSSNIIGYDSIGASGAIWNNDQYLGTKFTAGLTGTVTQLNAYIKDAYGGGFNQWSAAIYSVTSGLPDVLLASASGATLSDTLGWQSISISLSVTSGVEYYLCIWGQVAVETYYDAGTTNQSFDRYFVTYNTWDSPFSGTNYNQASNKYSIYVDVTPVSGSYTLTANSGSYTLTKNAVTLTTQRRLSLVQGAYTYSGQSVALGVSRRLLAVQGSYTLNGQTLNFKRGLVLNLVRGLYSLSGQNVNVIRQLTLSLTRGNYTLSGQNLVFVYTPVGSYVIVCHQGSYTITKNAVGLTKQSRVPLVQGSYSLSGKNLSFSVTRYLSLTKGNYTFTKNDISLIASRRLLMTKGNYNYTGFNPNLLTYRVINLNKGDYNLTGEDINFVYFYFRRRYFITS